MRLPSDETKLEPALVRIDTACRYLDIGRSKLYELIREGKLDCVKIGKPTRITTESLKRFVKSLPTTVSEPIRERISPVSPVIDFDDIDFDDTEVLLAMLRTPKETT